MRSSRCHWHAVTDSRASLPPSHGAGKDPVAEMSLAQSSCFTFGGWPKHHASPVSANTSAGSEFALLWGHALFTHPASTLEVNDERRCVVHGSTDHKIVLPSFIFTVWEINELSARGNVSAASFHSAERLSLAHLAVFPAETPAKETLRCKLTPHKGGLRVQLANKIKQTGAEILLLLKHASREWHWQRGSKRVGSL